MGEILLGEISLPEWPQRHSTVSCQLTIVSAQVQFTLIGCFTKQSVHDLRVRWEEILASTSEWLTLIEWKARQDVECLKISQIDWELFPRVAILLINGYPWWKKIHIPMGEHDLRIVQELSHILEFKGWK